MARNLTYFIETLPGDFDSWNATFRQTFFINELLGFEWVANSTQVFVATYFTRQNFIDLYDFAASLINDPEGTLSSVSDATAVFIQAITSDPVEVTTAAPSVCDNIFELDQFFVFVYFFPLAAVVLLMSFFKVRKNKWRDCCGGRPGILIPINFIDEYQRRWMYTAIFILLANRILYLFDGSFFIEFTIPKNFGFLRVFVILLNVIVVCMEFYPMLACVVMRRNVIANILGLLLTGPWIFAQVIKYSNCPPTRKAGLTGKEDSDYYEAVGTVLYESVLFLAELVIICGYFYDFILNIKQFCNSRRKLSDSDGKYSAPIIDSQETLCLVYINSLLKRKPPPKDLPFKERMKYKLRYARMQGFKYPPRVVCTVLIGLYALYKTATEFTFWGWYVTDLGQELYVANREFLVEILNSTQNVDLGLLYIRTAQWTMIGSLIASFIIQVLLMIHFVSQYRKHIGKFFRGDHSWHHKYTSSPAGTLVSGMRFSGYQVAFLVYGYVIVALVVFVIVMLFASFIVIPLATKTENALSRFFIEKFISLWPAVALGVMLYIAQIMMAKYIFLQDKGAYMSLNNRRLYHVISYFLFFFNVVLGFFSCLKRILFSLIFGTVLMSRLDRCLLMRGFERFDSGFSSYLGMLTVDVYHNHPIVKGFVHILKEQAQKSREAHGADNVYSIMDIKPNGIDGKSNSQTVLVVTEEKPAALHAMTAQKRVRNKYWKFVTLLNNPSLVLDRIHSDLAEMKQAQQDGKMAMVMDNLVGVTSVFFGSAVVAEVFDHTDTEVTTSL